MDSNFNNIELILFETFNNAYKIKSKLEQPIFNLQEKHEMCNQLQHLLASASDRLQKKNSTSDYSEFATLSNYNEKKIWNSDPKCQNKLEYLSSKIVNKQQKGHKSNIQDQMNKGRLKWFLGDPTHPFNLIACKEIFGLDLTKRENQKLLPKIIDYYSMQHCPDPPVQFSLADFHSPEERTVHKCPQSVDIVKTRYKIDPSLTAKELLASHVKPKYGLNINQRTQFVPPLQKLGTSDQIIEENPAAADVDHILTLIPTIGRRQPHLSPKAKLAIEIRYGVLDDSSEAFKSLELTHRAEWCEIREFLYAVEKFCARSAIPLAILDPNQIAPTALEHQVLREDLPLTRILDCFINKKEVTTLLKRPGQQFRGKNGENMAAVVIQKIVRQFLARKAIAMHVREMIIARKYVRNWIGKLRIKQIRKGLEAKRKQQKIGAKSRIMELGRNWSTFTSSPRVIIHIPSISLSFEKRNELAKSGDLEKLESRHFGRLCDLKDSNVDLILVTRSGVSEDILNYYSQLLGLIPQNEEDRKKFASRYLIIVPEAVNNFKNAMCLSTLLKYSPRALGIMREFIAGRPCLLVPGVGQHLDDFDVADQLRAPLLSPTNAWLRLADSRFSRRQLISSVSIKKEGKTAVEFQLLQAPGDHNVYTKEQFYETLAKLITSNLPIREYVLKLDTQFGSLGTALLPVETGISSTFTWANEQRLWLGATQWQTKRYQEPVFRRILSEVPLLVKTYLNPTRRDIFPNSKSFLNIFLTFGGVIEALPMAKEWTNISVDLVINPDRSCKILCSGDQLHSANKLRCWGLTVPMTSFDSRKLNSVCLSIGKACCEKGYLGHLTVDLVTFYHEETGEQLLWVSGLHAGYSENLAMFQFARLLGNTEFFVDHETEEHRCISSSIENQPANQTKDTNRRFVVVSAQLEHSCVSLLHYPVLLRMCQALGIGFHLESNEGTVLSLFSDSSHRENLGIVCVGKSLRDTLANFATNLQLLHNEITTPKMQGNSCYLTCIKEARDVIDQINANTRGDTKRTRMIKGRNEVKETRKPLVKMREKSSIEASTTAPIRIGLRNVSRLFAMVNK